MRQAAITRRRVELVDDIAAVQRRIERERQQLAKSERYLDTLLRELSTLPDVPDEAT